MFNNELQKIAHLRREYTKNNLHRKDLPREPLIFFKHWLNQAYEAKITDPTAMVVTTVDSNSQPYQRIVLLKHYDKKGFVFYTNLGSRKANHIKHNPNVSLLFPWNMLDRQVIITGKANFLPKFEVIEYFYSRPLDNQVSAWVSKQSKNISSRNILESKFFKLKQQSQQRKIPFPNFWGGFRVYIKQIEFWQGGKYRLHDRFLYQRKKNDIWKINRLAP